MRRQVAVYWAPGPDDDFGNETYAAPVELLVRWTDRNEEIVNGRGETKFTKSEVYVGQDVELDGVLWLSSKTKGYTAGEAIDELDDEDEPFKNENASAIQRFDKTPTMKADDFLRVAYL
jgi:hypothetical protein